MLRKLTGFLGEARLAAANLEAVLESPDGRWALVSTSATASVAVAITWLALAASPPGAASTYEPRRVQAALPYDLLPRFAGARPLPGILDAGEAATESGLRSEKAAGLERRTLTVANGDTLMGMLQEAGVPSQDAVAVVDAMRPVYSPRSIRAGQTFEAHFGLAESLFPPEADPGAISDPATLRLLSLSFSPTIERQITVEMTAPDEYAVSEMQRRLDARYQHAGATIDSSLYLAAMQAGIPAAIVVEMIHMFSYDVDFQRDVHAGDQFELFFNHYYTQEGEPARTGEILTASMVLGGKRHTLYRFVAPDGDEYFDAEGNSARSMLMRTPVDGARISSRFGARRHPILGYTRMHKGIDFAVPTGTPVMAAGNGTVGLAGRSGDYGNLLVINHANGYATAYGHLSRFGAGVRAGARVRQGDIVAYAGMTGLATGPHVHYEIRVNGVQVNPANVRVANGRKLEGEDLREFQAERSRIERFAATLPMQSTVAEATGLRNTTQQ